MLKALKDKVVAVTVNGKPAKWSWMQNEVGGPKIEISVGSVKQMLIKIIWAGNDFENIIFKPVLFAAEKGSISLGKAICIGIDDPQQAITTFNVEKNKLLFEVGKNENYYAAFLLLKQGAVSWLQPISFKTVGVGIVANAEFKLSVNTSFSTIDLQPYFNDKVTQIFKNKYLSPRPQSPTLQIPWQGIGNWCYPLTDANINDSGVRAKAGVENKIYFDKIPFATPSAMEAKNIIYTSQWDNYPKSAIIPLAGKAQHVYFLMAGSTNHQQSQFTNAKIIVTYTDGATDELPLINPSNWYPIEQDYLDDGFAFTTAAPKPYRLLLKTGEFTKKVDKFSTIKGFSNRAIDGGAATVIEMPLDKNKELKSMQLVTLANEVVVGLMSATLAR